MVLTQRRPSGTTLNPVIIIFFLIFANTQKVSIDGRWNASSKDQVILDISQTGKQWDRQQPTGTTDEKKTGIDVCL